MADGAPVVTLPAGPDTTDTTLVVEDGIPGARGVWKPMGRGLSRTARPFALMLALLCLAVALIAGTASAHTLDTEGFSEIEQRGDAVRYDLSVDYAALAKVTALGEPGAAFPENAEGELRAGRAEVARYLDENLQVFVDGVACEGSIVETDVERRLGQPHARISLLYYCPGTGEYELRYSVLFGDLDPGHTNVAGYDLGGEEGEVVFDEQNRELTVGEGSLLGSVYRFVGLGFHHILAGIDHILFVVALLIGARDLRGVFEVVTAFTLAHSITLILTALGWISLPPTIVEPLIALSIAYVAAENFFGGKGSRRYRLAAVFGFGLLHGMGFAGTLELTGDVDWRAILSLLTFNVGIELGQALVVVLLFPLLLFVRRFKWSPYAQLGATGVISLFGFAWFFERLFLA